MFAHYALKRISYRFLKYKTGVKERQFNYNF
jgi:hypothetical protein